MDTILVTGGAGFIGSHIVKKLNGLGYRDITIVDDLGTGEKWKNLRGLRYRELIPVAKARDWLASTSSKVNHVFHMGACSTTTETDADYLMANNTGDSVFYANHCARHKIPFIYASSAATYGDGACGFSDATLDLLPINAYGYSKFQFDQWILAQSMSSPEFQNFFWAGLKFFNVFGPQEYHKGSQASVVYHAFHQIQNTGSMKLFKSHHPDYEDGKQLRDFIYIEDVVKMMFSVWDQRNNPKDSGVYNVGTGKARTFLDLVTAVFHALDKPVKIKWIETPISLRDQYQYYTQADMTRLKKMMGSEVMCQELEESVSNYVKDYLLATNPYLRA